MAGLPSTNSPLGLFVAPTAAGPPSPLLADHIDPSTRDFASLTQSVNPIDAQVFLALSTVRNSGASVMDLGMEPPPSKILDSAQAVITSQVNQALGRLIANQDIQLHSVEFPLVSEADNQIDIKVNYLNLRALDSSIRTLPMPISPKVPV